MLRCETSEEVFQDYESGTYIKRVSPENGYKIFIKAAEKYAVKVLSPSRDEFGTRILNTVENDYWGIIDIETERLVALSLNYVSEECCEYLTMKAIPEFQKNKLTMA